MGIGRQRWLLKISMEDLVDYAHDFDRGPQERKKKAKTHLPSQGSAWAVHATRPG
jgi:hypothetical protein